ncbi:vacuolar sorting-associated 35 protein [Rutstroemia sp. NJR-2017a BBW]|nr:vacuolar sorting-associated 35 protein [Rutstroemia sp. NJR-2017a BBW]
MATPPQVVEDQARLLEDALNVVRQQTQLMRRCLESPGKLMDALKCSSTLVSELRTSSLGPKQYYELYMAVFDALRHLSSHLKDSHPTHHLADLYELVQYAGNIVPRLYLMITVGTVYMGVPEAPVKEIMKDMMEMSRGVQHPIRGLFLRYYLSGQAREHLPQTDGDGPEGNLTDSISFVLTNFVEMNKLWVRLQHQGHSREREMRTQERKELQLLVGSNLVRLSQLVDLDVYKNTILQPLLEQVVQCRDVLAQEYLLEVITQVFPDEYHLHTLDQFLGAVSRLNPQVNMKVIVIAMMDRLSEYAARETDSNSVVDRSKLEEEAVRRLLENSKLSKESKNAESKSPAQPGSASESNGHSPSTETNNENSKAPEKDDDALSKAPTEVESLAESEATVGNDGTNERSKAIPENIKLYEIFFEQVMNLVASQRLSVQDTLALLVSLVNLALKVHPDRLDYVDQVLEYAAERIKAYANTPELHSPEAQRNILNLLQIPITSYASIFTAIIHLIHNDDNDIQFKLLQTTKAAYSEGNERVKFTTPALITSAMKLARRFKAREHYEDNWESQISALFKFMHSSLSTMYTRVSTSAELCLRLFVACGQIADQTGFEEVSYEFFAQAFTIYEEAISDSRAQFQAVCVIAAALHETRNFSKENYDTLITKCALHGSKLLKKPDQCRAVYLASHLWWAVPIAARGETEKDKEENKLYRDGKRVLECLQRALRVADACMDTAVSVELFVEILNRYVYYFEEKNEAVTTKYLNGLIELIHSNLQGNQDSATIDMPRRHFQRTLENIANRELDGVVTAAAP